MKKNLMVIGMEALVAITLMSVLWSNSAQATPCPQPVNCPSVFPCQNSGLSNGTYIACKEQNKFPKLVCQEDEDGYYPGSDRCAKPFTGTQSGGCNTPFSGDCGQATDVVIAGTCP